MWLDRAASATKTPDAEIYVVRRGRTRAVRPARAWQVAPAADGRAVWLKSYTRARRCDLREVALNGRQRRSRAGAPFGAARRLRRGPLLVQGRAHFDPRTEELLLQAASGQDRPDRARAPGRAAHSPCPTAGWAMPWPSQIGGTDQAAVHSNGGSIALSFSDPAHQGGGEQVTDPWLLDRARRALHHLPCRRRSRSSSRACSGRATAGWSSSQRLRQNVVAVWRPGQER